MTPPVPVGGTGRASLRYFVVAAGIAPVGYETLEVAISVARQYGEGTDIVDSEATPYHPMAQRIENGEAVFLEFGAWPRKGSLDADLIEAVKTGCPSIVRTFMAKGANVNARDENGGTPLIWAVARRVAETVSILIAAGADPDARDLGGRSELDLARTRKMPSIEEILTAALAKKTS